MGSCSLCSNYLYFIEPEIQSPLNNIHGSNQIKLERYYSIPLHSIINGDICSGDIESRKLFSSIVNSQISFGNNAKVNSIEKSLGNFPFDDRLINDGIPKIVVGPEQLENGAIYYGHWNPDTNERHGFGLQIWSDGSKYVGYWKFDKANGMGRLIHNEGDVYVGGWKDDFANGIGTYTNVDGMRYEGGWVDDQQSGKGILLW